MLQQEDRTFFFFFGRPKHWKGKFQRRKFNTQLSWAKVFSVISRTFGIFLFWILWHAIRKSEKEVLLNLLFFLSCNIFTLNVWASKDWIWGGFEWEQNSAQLYKVKKIAFSELQIKEFAILDGNPKYCFKCQQDRCRLSWNEVGSWMAVVLLHIEDREHTWKLYNIAKWRQE